MKHTVISLLFTLAVLVVGGCGFGETSEDTGLFGRWTWISGSNTANQAGSYGTKGTASAANVPGARDSAVTWTDKSGNFWLFGGRSRDSVVGNQVFNDLWKFNGSDWVWVSGSDLPNQAGSYGTKGSATAGNVPGGRYNALSWVDSNDNLWLFGGVDASGLHLLNDLWKFDGSNWTWVSGSNTADQAGIYGTRGTAAAANAPGGRAGSVTWIDASGALWLFGGFGYDSAGQLSIINDLWRFDGNNWTWIGGSNTVRQQGDYGVRNVAAAGNVPGARWGAVSFTDSRGRFWLFGGNGYDAVGNSGYLNDLWQYADGNWTWIKGSNRINQPGSYGSKGVAETSNNPGARAGAVSWIDGNDKLWLFGGILGRVYPGTSGATDTLCDLWSFDGSNWTWESGPTTANHPGLFGSKGVPTTANTPRSRATASSWIDSGGKLWLFGGSYNQSTTADVFLNDLWRFER